MSKKDKKKEGKLPLPADLKSAAPSVISRRGWKIIGFGVFVVFSGFVVLSFTDPQGQNWASRLSPFLIIGGYALIGWGIVSKDPAPTLP